MTKIQWTDTTWNPVTGCTKVSPGCLNCYAEKMAKRLQAMGQPKYADGFKVKLHPDVFDKPLHWKKPRKIFVCSMSDLFHEDVPIAFIDCVIHTMAVCPQHKFQLLTKRPERMKFVLGGKGVLPNVWLGVTAEDQQRAHERIPPLHAAPAAVRFLSLEPLLGPIFLGSYLIGIDQVIVGGESGPNRRECKIEWVRDIVEQCRSAGVAVFVKQLHIDGKLVKDIEQFPEDLRIREFPK